MHKIFYFAFVGLLAVTLGSCKDDTIYEGLRNSTWTLDDQVHFSDNVNANGPYFYASEIHDGKVAEVEVLFFGTSKPTVGGEYRIVDVADTLGEVSIRSFQRSQVDSNYRSFEGFNVQPKAILSFANGRPNLKITDALLANEKDTVMFSCNLEPRNP